MKLVDLIMCAVTMHAVCRDARSIAIDPTIGLMAMLRASLPKSVQKVWR